MLHHIGDTARLSTTFTVAGTPTDPTTVTLVVTTPAGVATTYTYGAGEVTRASAGAFYRDVALGAAGIWTWRWVGTGAAAGVDEGTLTVEDALPGATLCSTSAVKEHLETGVTSSDDLIERLSVQAAHAIMAWTGRRIRPLDTAATDRYFEAADAHVYERANRRLWVLDLSAAPTQVEILDSAGDSVATLTIADDLVLLPRNREGWRPVESLRLRPSATAPALGHEVRVRGIWGWPKVPPDVEQAAIITVRSWLRQPPSDLSAFDDFSGARGGFSPTPGGGWMLPIAARQLLRPYRLAGIA